MIDELESDLAHKYTYNLHSDSFPIEIKKDLVEYKNGSSKMKVSSICSNEYTRYFKNTNVRAIMIGTIEDSSPTSKTIVSISSSFCSIATFSTVLIISNTMPSSCQTITYSYCYVPRGRYINWKFMFAIMGIISLYLVVKLLMGLKKENIIIISNGDNEQLSELRK
ncbi:hypothetical protein [Clostridium sp.]